MRKWFNILAHEGKTPMPEGYSGVGTDSLPPSELPPHLGDTMKRLDRRVR